MLAKRRWAQRREGRGTSLGKMLQPAGTVMMSLAAVVNHLVTWAMLSVAGGFGGLIFAWFRSPFSRLGGLDPTLILTNNGVSNAIRAISRNVTLTGGANKWNGVTTAGATASWDAELTEVSDDTPTVGPAQIPVYAAKALIMASIESFEDIAGLTADVQMILADARDRLEAVAHATGSGSGQPTGIFTALADAIEARTDQFADVLCAEQGLPQNAAGEHSSPPYCFGTSAR